MKNEFIHELGDRILLVETAESGIVVGRADYIKTENSYYVRYKDANGNQKLRWWSEADIKSV